MTPADRRKSNRAYYLRHRERILAQKAVAYRRDRALILAKCRARYWRGRVVALSTQAPSASTLTPSRLS